MKFSAVFPVAVSGMITLPVTAQMYHSLVQQQLPNNENTVCVTPMQVQNFIANSNNLCSSLVNNSSTTTTTYQIMTTTANHNRNLFNFPFTSHSINKSVIKPVITSCNNNNLKGRLAVVNKKQMIKKKVLNVATTVTKSSIKSLATTTKMVKFKSNQNSSNNNNEESVKNKNKNFSKCEKKIANKNKPKLESKVSKKEADIESVKE